MAKIVLDAREYFSSGAGRYIRNLLAQLEQIDHKNSYIVLLPPKDMDSYRPTNPSFAKLATTDEKFSFSEQTHLKKQIEALKPDLVHFAMVQQPVFYRGHTVTTMHDLTTIRFRNPVSNPAIFWVKQQVYKWVNKRVAHKSDTVITPSEFVRQDIASYCHVPLEKIVATPEAADAVADKPEPIESLKDKTFIMYTGRPTPHKNLARLIDAFVEMQKLHPDLMLVLVGKTDFNYTQHEERVKRDGISNVVFTDFVSDGQLRWLYENCVAYVFPSLSEGFGLPGLEAMLHGAPVVSSNATCLPEVYGDAAHYFNPLDVDDMVRAINEVIAGEKLREKLVKSGYEQVKKYSWRRMAEQTLAVYEKTLNSNR